MLTTLEAKILQTFIYRQPYFDCKLEHRVYDIVPSTDGTGTVLVRDYFLETETRYRVKIEVEPLIIKSTADPGPWLQFASRLKKQANVKVEKVS